MLCADNDRLDPFRRAVFIFDSDLRFPVRAKPIENPAAANLGEAHRKTVCECYRQRHKHAGFVRCITEHKPLVAGTLAIDPKRDIRRLLIDRLDYCDTLPVKSGLRVSVSDLFHRSTNDLLDIDICFRGDFTADHHKAGRGKTFASDTPIFVVFQNTIQNGVRNLIAYLIWMPLRYAFRTK